MKTFKNLIYLIVLILSFAQISCDEKKENTPTPEKKGNISFYFDNQIVVGTTSSKIILDNNDNFNDTTTALNENALYKNAFGNELNINKVRYWVSNVVLYDSTLKAFAEPNSYHLIDLRKKEGIVKEVFTITGVPNGKYRKISFSIGVDPAQNHNISNLLGDLSPNVGMSWTWETGYIFYMLEGRYKKNNGYYGYYWYHVGKDENYRIITLDLPEPIEVEEKGLPSIHLKNNILATWGIAENETTTLIDLNKVNSLHGGATSSSVANNYVNAVFEVDHVHNHHDE